MNCAVNRNTIFGVAFAWFALKTNQFDFAFIYNLTVRSFYWFILVYEADYKYVVCSSFVGVSTTDSSPWPSKSQRDLRSYVKTCQSNTLWIN